jgi:hypothetical protein
MIGTTRTTQQPATTGAILAALGMAAVILTAAIAIAWGSANLGNPSAPAAAPAVVRGPIDHGSRDELAKPESFGNSIKDHYAPKNYGASTGSSSVGGFGGSRLGDAPTSGSTNAGLRAQ